MTGFFPTPVRVDILADIADERLEQERIWGADRRHPDLMGDHDGAAFDREMFSEFADRYKRINDSGPSDWTAIFLEEVYEALSESDPDKIRAELIQALAVGVAWIEDIDTRKGKV